MRLAPGVQFDGGVNAGRILDDRFLLVEQIGRGGMSTIFRAEDLHDHRRAVAVKVPLPIFSSGIGSWSIFQREEEIGRKLDHPFVLKFLPLDGPARQRSYVATELVPGRTLHERLRDERPLPEREALRIAGTDLRRRRLTCTAAGSCTTTSSRAT